MIIFTLKARQFINRSVNQFGNDAQKEIWRSWSAANPIMRRGPADPWDDGRPIPYRVIEVARSTLNQMYDSIARRVDSKEVSEDEAVGLCNDLSYIQSIAKLFGGLVHETLG